MKIDEQTYNKMPKDLQVFFSKLQNSGSEEVLELFPNTKSGDLLPSHKLKASKNNCMSGDNQERSPNTIFGRDSRAAARFFQFCPYTEEDLCQDLNQNLLSIDGSVENVILDFMLKKRVLGEKDLIRFKYCAKANKKDRDEGCEDLENHKFQAGNYSQSPVCKTCDKTLNGTNDHTNCSGEVYYRKNDSKLGNNHPTVKPTSLMQYLCRLITPKGGTILDPFMGSGSTGKAAILEGFDFIGIEKEEEYMKIAEARINAAKKSLEDKKPFWEKKCLTE